MPTQHIATLLGATCCVHLATVLGAVGLKLTIFKFEPAIPNMSQHIATRWPNTRNMFGWGLKIKLLLREREI